MARWRTLNKRARRRRERDIEASRNVTDLLRRMESVEFQTALKAACDNFGTALRQMASAIQTAFERASHEMSEGWKPLDPKYVRLRSKRWEWPEIVLEDILDAEYITDQN